VARLALAVAALGNQNREEFLRCAFDGGLVCAIPRLQKTASDQQISKLAEVNLKPKARLALAASLSVCAIASAALSS
jgi:hypothetical protein